MKLAKRLVAARKRRLARVRAKIKGTPERPRLTVRRSLKHIYAQIVEDASGRTLVAAADTEIKAGKKKTKTEIAAEVGKLLAERAQKKKLTTVVFDRRDKKYHGRLKALAEAARAGGLIF